MRDKIFEKKGVVCLIRTRHILTLNAPESVYSVSKYLNANRSKSTRSVTERADSHDCSKYIYYNVNV